MNIEKMQAELLTDGINSYIMQSIVGDGDCAFHALETDRNSVIEILKNADLAHKKELAPEVQEAFGQDIFPDNHPVFSVAVTMFKQLKNEEYKINEEITENSRHLESPDVSLEDRLAYRIANLENGHLRDALIELQNRQKVNNQALQNFFISQIDNYLDHGLGVQGLKLWAGYFTISTYAKIKNIGVTIWVKVPQSNRIKQALRVEGNNVIHLFHTDNYTHINRLHQITNAQLADVSLFKDLFDKAINNEKLDVRHADFKGAIQRLSQLRMPFVKDNYQNILMINYLFYLQNKLANLSSQASAAKANNPPYQDIEDVKILPKTRKNAFEDALIIFVNNLYVPGISRKKRLKVTNIKNCLIDDDHISNIYQITGAKKSYMRSLVDLFRIQAIFEKILNNISGDNIFTIVKDGIKRITKLFVHISKNQMFFLQRKDQMTFYLTYLDFLKVIYQIDYASCEITKLQQLYGQMIKVGNKSFNISLDTQAIAFIAVKTYLSEFFEESVFDTSYFKNISSVMPVIKQKFVKRARKNKDPVFSCNHKKQIIEDENGEAKPVTPPDNRYLNFLASVALEEKSSETMPKIT